MNKYSITRRTIIGKLLFGIPIVLFTSFTYLVNIHPLDEEGSLQLKLYMLLDVWLWLIILSTFLVIGLLIYIVIRKHKFYAKGEFFVVEKGLFWKREIKLSYKQINTVSIKRSLIDLIFGIAKVEVDSGAALSIMPEVKLHLPLGYAKYLKRYLESKQRGKDIALEGPKNYNYTKEQNYNIVYKLKKSSLILMGIIQQGLMVAAFITTSILSSVLNVIAVNKPDKPEPRFILEAFLIIILMLFLFVGIILFVTIVNFFKYYNYKLIENDNSLEYEYGLIAKNSFKFDKDKINAVYIKRPILYRLFKKYSLEVSVIGIGDELDHNKNKVESKYLLPIATKEELEKVLNIINANDLLEEDLERPIKFAKLNLIFLPLIAPTILFISVLVLIFLSDNIYYLIILNIIISYFIVVAHNILKYKYHGYRLDDKLLIRSGSFTTKIALMKKDSIQLISFNNGPIRRLLGIGSINFHYKSFFEMVNIKGLVIEDFHYFNKKIF